MPFAKPSRNRYTWDMETNGLDRGGGKKPEDCTQVWCSSFYDHDTKQFHNFNVEDGLEGMRAILEEATLLVCHNELDFDLHVVKRLMGIVPHAECELIDTLVMSRSLYPDRTFNGGHGLAAWGERNGYPKPPIDDWSFYDEAKMHRCIEDVKNNHITYQKLTDEANMYDSWPMLHLEHKVSHIISQQTRRGWVANTQLMCKLLYWLEMHILELDTELMPLMKHKQVQYGASVKKPRNMNGDYSAAVYGWFKDELEANYKYGPVTPGKRFEVLSGLCSEEEPSAFSRIHTKDINLGSNDQMIEQLKWQGWEPIEFTQKGNPQITEESILQADLPPVALRILERRKYAARRSMVRGWLRNIDPDGRIRGSVNPQGATTLRMTHQKVVNVPKHKKEEKYSEHYRACFTVPKDKVLVGVDAAGLENRMLAHEMNDATMSEILCGGDFHTTLWKVINHWVDSRDNTKNIEYAFFYGAGDIKLGAMADNLDEITEDEAKGLGWHMVKSGESKGLWKRGKSKAVTWKLVQYNVNGSRIRSAISDGLPALGQLIDRVKEESLCGHVTLPDGRRLIMRRGFDHSVQTHKSLNTKLQGLGALVMKIAQCYLYDWLKGLSAWFLYVSHDEFQLECDPDIAERVKLMAIRSIVQAGKYLKLNVPLDASGDIGQSWADTH